MRDTATPSRTLPARGSERLPSVHHLLDVLSLPRSVVETILQRAGFMEALLRGTAAARLQGKILATLFYEPSTRTRLSFEAAMLRLGGQVVSTADAAIASSAAKGESLQDTIRIVAGYADAIVLRHPQVGAAARAAAVSTVPVINAGDGGGEHPTQALLDLFTIQRELGRIDNLRVGLMGDLAHGRAARSLALLLSRFEKNELVLIAPPALQMRDDVLEPLARAGTRVHQVSDAKPVAPGLDVLYQTRIQKERLASPHHAPATPVVDGDLMRRLAPSAIVMHPLPRVDEIDPAVDADPRAAYFRQARNGLPVRMAVLEWLLE